MIHKEKSGLGTDSENEEEIGGSTSSKVITAKTAETVYASNTVITDVYGNKITIPSGFKIASDSGEDVTQGIVIEDVNNGNAGSQFVWVPCGTIYTNTTKTESKTINLGRYINFTKSANGYVENTDYVTSGTEITISNAGYTEATKNETTNNTHAIDIEAFKTSVATNGGYYIGRYEAGDSSATSARSSATDGTLVCKENQEVYNYITQGDAATKCRNMYISSNFTSDLVNSYAWDTAIIYIQEFGGDTSYSNNNYCTSIRKTGTNSDKFCNIYDMSGNVWEYTTETYSENSLYPCVHRGGYYDTSYHKAKDYTSNRCDNSTTYNRYRSGFRPLLYVGN